MLDYECGTAFASGTRDQQLNFSLEFFRGDTRPFWGFLTAGQAMALGAALFGLVFLFAVRRTSGN